MKNPSTEKVTLFITLTTDLLNIKIGEYNELFMLITTLNPDVICF